MTDGISFTPIFAAAGPIVASAMLSQPESSEDVALGLSIARRMFARRNASFDQIEAAIETLTTYGDHSDHMRAEMLRAALNRRARAGAATCHHTTPQSPCTYFEAPPSGP